MKIKTSTSLILLLKPILIPDHTIHIAVKGQSHILGKIHLKVRIVTMCIVTKKLTTADD